MPRSHVWLWGAVAVFVVVTITFLLTIDHFYAPKQKPAQQGVESAA